jgi:E1A/CREB-binding protein
MAQNQTDANKKQAGWRTWQSDEDIPQRKVLIQHILRLFQQRKPSVTKEWQQKLPDFVLRLEEAVYRGARTKEEYCDKDTLEARLQAVARIMVTRPGAKAVQMQQQQQQMQQQKQQQQQQMGGAANGSLPPGVLIGSGGMPPLGQMVPTTNGGANVLANGQRLIRGQAADSPGANAAPMQMLGPNGVPMTVSSGGQAQLMQPGQQQQHVPTTAAEKKAAAARAKAIAAASKQQAAGTTTTAEGNGKKAKKESKAQTAARLANEQRDVQQQQQQQQTNQIRPGASAPPGSTDEQIKKAYIVKQQRWLLFLRHASKCQAPEGKCPYTPHCHVAKHLWEHVLKCTLPTCQYPRCLASRELLKHHQNCKDPRCPVCGPVRSAMLKQRQQQQAMLAQQQAQQTAGAGNKRQKLTKAEQAALKAQQAQFDFAPPQLMVKGTGNANREPGNEGTSLMECFTQEEIRTHLASLRLTEGKEKIPGVVAPMSARRRDAESEKAIANATESSCRACGVERLTFEPPPMYCFTCVGRIKRGQVYYAAPNIPGGENRKDTWCNPCYNAIQGFIDIEGQKFPKNSLIKKKNDDDLEEPWVQCDFCNNWYHQICVLFNGRKNTDGEAHFTCPTCIMSQIDKGERKVTTERPNSMQPAETLTKTVLGDFLEKRVSDALSEERVARAKHLGIPVETTPTAEDLTIRVVSQTEKKCDTKTHFLQHFKEDGYPEEFLYKNRVILLFQKIEGVDVCLMAIYVQEYGGDCPEPNQRRIYLSYLDSVKYFRPEGIIAQIGEPMALRTFVYHQILIGYLDFAKQRGFTSCFIWACPPFQGDDYILYCHPKVQKVPKSDKLREWYIKMLRGAAKEGIVHSVTNVYDEYNLGGSLNEVRSAKTYPYFDGDYFPGVAEDWIPGILAEQEEQKTQIKTLPTGTKVNARKAAKGRDKKVYSATADGDLDTELMKKLGVTISAMRNDFILAHLAPKCTNCRKTVAEENLFVPKEENPKNPLRLCEECNSVESALPKEEKKFLNRGELICQKCPPLPALKDNNKDEDKAMQSEFFDTRQAFLSLCQGNHFQFDSLRRAKHTTMMVLYHLNNPSEPAFVASCNVCSRELEAGAGYRCTKCADFDICEECRQRVGHQHPLQRQGRGRGEKQEMTDEERQARQQQIERTMALLVHASSCTDGKCDNPNCIKVKQLFQHAMKCQTKAAGGCHLCRKIWTLLQVHSKGCVAHECPVPRCADLKAYRRRAQEQVEERRRKQYRKYLAGSG